jgi:hypothetical protein
MELGNSATEVLEKVCEASGNHSIGQTAVFE